MQFIGYPDSLSNVLHFCKFCYGCMRKDLSWSWPWGLTFWLWLHHWL